MSKPKRETFSIPTRDGSVIMSLRVPNPLTKLDIARIRSWLEVMFPGEPARPTRDDGLCCGFAESNRCCENYPPCTDAGHRPEESEHGE